LATFSKVHFVLIGHSGNPSYLCKDGKNGKLSYESHIFSEFMGLSNKTSRSFVREIAGCNPGKTPLDVFQNQLTQSVFAKYSHRRHIFGGLPEKNHG
jgi:hypothetical protein